MSKDVVGAIQGLYKLADRILSLLREEISLDYKKFGGASKDYADMSEDIRHSMERLQQITERYAKSLENIKDAILSISAASEENSAEIVNVSELLRAMGTDMKNIEASTGETVSAIFSMNRDLSSYRI